MNREVDTSKAVEIAEGIYWVGFHDESAGFHCNPYVILDGKEAVLIDPGSIPHYPLVLNKVVSVVELPRIRYIIAHHQDPDLCAAIPKFEEVINRPTSVVTHTRASVLIAHYGLKSDFYAVDQKDWQLTLQSGRRLRFIFTPYLHFPGAFVTYDEKTKTLFTSDLFGALSFDWHLYAGEYYIEGMKAFHENYMPSREILAASMRKLKKLDIKLIAPQHGSLIDENILEYIEALENLECGDYMFYQD